MITGGEDGALGETSAMKKDLPHDRVPFFVTRWYLPSDAREENQQEDT